MILSRHSALLAGLAATLAFGAMLVVAFPSPDWDYRCYVNAAELLRLGENPYSPQLGTQYLYPPLPAHVFLLLRSALGSDALVFALFQTAQMALLGAGYGLTYTLARRLGATRTHAAAAAALLLVVNFPLFYTLRHHNTNLALLDAALLAMLFPQRAMLVGLALAATTQIKLYPALLLVPLWAFGHRRAAVWWGVGMSLPMGFAAIREGWWQFLAILPDMPKGEAVLDNSVTSLIERGLLLLDQDASTTAIKLAAAAVALPALGLMLARLRRRVRAPDGNRHGLLLSCAEWTAVVLVISPIAWPEHFVLGVPLAMILLIEHRGRALVLAAAALMLAFPRTPLFPLSHHYLAGLVLLLGLSGIRSGSDASASRAAEQPALR